MLQSQRQRAAPLDVVTNLTKTSDVNIGDVWRSLLTSHHYISYQIRPRVFGNVFAVLRKLCTVNLLIFVDHRPSKAPQFFEHAQRVGGILGKVTIRKLGNV